MPNLYADMTRISLTLLHILYVREFFYEKYIIKISFSKVEFQAIFRPTQFTPSFKTYVWCVRAPRVGYLSDLQFLNFDKNARFKIRNLTSWGRASGGV